MVDKNALKAEKERLKQELKYYDNRLRDLQKEIRLKQVFECDSSDSENEIFTLANIGPAISQLKSEKYLHETCLQATQELTSVAVLQAEVDCLTEAPKYEHGTTIKEVGKWREVTAECRIDLVPFSINFYTHTANRMFAPTLYRGLQVLPVKKAQEIELSKSVLSHVDKPSDAVKVLKSYATAYRARRTTLARLADKYANELHMERLAEGGYLLKCGSVLELSWRLENRLSPLSPFHDKMKFDLDYMDESHLKTITQAHKNLSDPSIDAIERTTLLSKIISTCLELKQLHEESMESDVESKKLEKTVLEDNFEENSGENGEHLGGNNEDLGDNVEQEVENGEKSSNKRESALKKNNENASRNTKNVEKTSKNTENPSKNNETASKNNKKSPQNVDNNTKNAENEIMAPPKSLPKKTKPKTKDNTTDNRKPVKRTAEADQNGPKKAKITEKPEQNIAGALKEAKNYKTNEKNDKNVPDAQKDPKKAKTSEKVGQTVGQMVKNGVSDDVDYNSFVATLNERNSVVSSINKNQDENHDVQYNAKKAKINENQVKSSEKNNRNSKNSKTSQKVTEKQINDPKNDQNKPKNYEKANQIVKNINSENNPKSQNEKSKNIKQTATDKQSSKNNAPKAKIVDNNKENADLNQNQEKNNQNIEKPMENSEKTDKTSKNKPVTKNDLKSKEKAKNPSKPLTNSEKTIKISKKGAVETNTNATKKVTNPVPSSSTEKKVHNNEKSNKHVQNNEKSNKNLPKTSEMSKNLQKDKNTENKQPKNDKQITNSKEITNKTSTTDPKSTKNVTTLKNIAGKNKLLIKSHKNTPKVKKTGNTGSVKDGKISKIPQKKFSSTSDTNLKKVLRISPRKFPSKFKSPSDSNLLGKMAKVHTNIPILKKPARKV